MPTTRFFPNVGHNGLPQALPDIARWLVNDHPVYTGPAGWQILEAQWQNNREVPSISTDIDSFVSAVGWASGTVGPGDWIVLQSGQSDSGKRFELFFNLESSGSMGIVMMPQGGYTAGFPAMTYPNFPTASFGESSGTLYTIAGPESVSGSFNVVADEAMCAMMFTDLLGTSASWTYVGELNGARLSGSPPDTNPFVVWTNTNDVSWSQSVIDVNKGFHRVSPLSNDNFTEFMTGVNGGVAAQFYDLGAGSAVMNGGTAETLLGTDYVMPVGVYFGSMHRHFAGWLRNVYAMHASLTSSHASQPHRGTTVARQFMFNNDTSGSDPAIAFRWDGSTPFPS